MCPERAPGAPGRRRRWAAAFGFSRPEVGWFGWGYVLLVLFLLFYPFSAMGGMSLWKETLPYAIHAGMWAGLVWCFWPLTEGRGNRQWWLLLLLVLAGGASEIIQNLTGRSPEWQDWGMDSLGAVIGFLHGRGWKKMGMAVAGGLVLALVAHVISRKVEEWRAYPVLADCQQRWSRYRWERNGVKMLSGKKFFRVQKDPEAETAYPGIFRFPLRGDWRGSRGMELDVYWPRKNGTPAMLGVRVDDRKDNPPYGDRYQAELTVSNGWNHLIVDQDWLRTPDGREMDARQIHTWGVFVISCPQTNIFGLKKAVLLTDGQSGSGNGRTP